MFSYIFNFIFSYLFPIQIQDTFTYIPSEGIYTSKYIIQCYYKYFYIEQLYCNNQYLFQIIFNMYNIIQPKLIVTGFVLDNIDPLNGSTFNISDIKLGFQFNLFYLIGYNINVSSFFCFNKGLGFSFSFIYP